MAVGLSPAHFLALLNTAAFTGQLAARLDALLRKPALVHLQHVAHGLGEQCESSVCGFMSARFTMVPSSATKAAVSSKACSSSRSTAWLFKHKQHALMRGHFLAVHQPGLRSWGDAACASMRCMPAVISMRGKFDLEVGQPNPRRRRAVLAEQSGRWQATRLGGGERRGMVAFRKGCWVARCAARISSNSDGRRRAVWRFVFGGLPLGAGSARCAPGRRTAEQQTLK